MFGSTVLEIGIGLAFVFFILSLVASAIAESISQALKWRSKNLEDGIKNLLADEAFAQEFYDHALIKAMSKGNRKPSYIPAQTFTTVILDLERGLEDKGRLPKQLAEALRVFREQVTDTVKDVRSAVEDWFDQTMDRVSGWYKRKLQLALWIIGLGAAVVVNGDAIAIVDTLSKNQAVREAVVAAAVTQVGSGPVTQAGDDSGQPPSLGSRVSQVAQDVEDLTGLGIPLGWHGIPDDADPRWWFEKIVGLLLTAAAVSLGAPFWFSALNKLVNLRGAGRSPKRGQEARAEAAGHK